MNNTDRTMATSVSGHGTRSTPRLAAGKACPVCPKRITQATIIAILPAAVTRNNVAVMTVPTVTFSGAATA